MKIDLGTRIAIVTGAASGIGSTIAETLAAAGAEVVICDSSAERVAAFRENHPTILAALADVGNPTDVDALFSLAERRFGAVNVLVNNAGIAGPTARVEEAPLDGWEATLRVNLSGPFYCIKRAAAAMRAMKDGAIVNISSVAGRLGFPLRVPYSATKWGLIGMTETLAMELGPSNVRVNAVLPGLVDNDRARRIIDAQATTGGVSFEESMSRFLSRISMRTMVKPEEIASTVAFLVSDLGRHISGQSISVCGNFESYGSDLR